jgi:hypothetical protein
MLRLEADLNNPLVYAVNIIIGLFF